jgi:hypothetical protein
VELGAPGDAWATLRLDRGEGPFVVDVTWAEVSRMVVSSALIRRR